MFAAQGIAGVPEARPVALTVRNVAARTLGLALGELSGQFAHERFHHSRPDGGPFPRDECRMCAAFKAGETHRVDDEVFWRKDGSSIPVEYCSVPIRDDAGNPIGAVVTFSDITERLRQHEELEQERRISALGRTAATICHEFNNVLMGIDPFSELLKRKPEEPATVLRAAETIHKCVLRGKAITADLLRFARPQQPSLQTVDIAAWLRENEAEVRNLAGAHIALNVQTRTDGARVFADPMQLTQVLTNLISNARDAMNGKGSLEIRAEANESSVVLRVRDSGCGMTPDIIDRIFEPLFTNKRTGTGLGLAVASQIVRKHAGTISVASRIGEGTTFTIGLPRWTPGLEDPG